LLKVVFVTVPPLPPVERTALRAPLPVTGMRLWLQALPALLCVVLADDAGLCSEGDDTSLLSKRRVALSVPAKSKAPSSPAGPAFLESGHASAASPSPPATCTPTGNDPDVCDSTADCGGAGFLVRHLPWMRPPAVGGRSGMSCKVNCDEDPSGFCFQGNSSQCSDGECTELCVTPPPGICITGYCVKAGNENADPDCTSHDCALDGGICVGHSGEVCFSPSDYGCDKAISHFVMHWDWCFNCAITPAPTAEPTRAPTPAPPPTPAPTPVPTPAPKECRRRRTKKPDWPEAWCRRRRTPPKDCRRRRAHGPWPYLAEGSAADEGRA